MTAYAFIFGIGVLVDLFYAVLNVRSPAPPIIAPVALLGIVIGEQLVPFARAQSGEVCSTSPAKLRENQRI